MPLNGTNGFGIASLQNSGQLLQTRVDARPIAYIRVLIGGAALLRAQEAWAILTEVLRPGVMRFPNIAGLPELTMDTLLWFIGAWAIAALCFTLGWQTRLSGAILTLLMGYVLLFDQQTYSNHLYLLVIVVGLLTVGDSGAAFSLDARSAKKQDPTPTVSYWIVFLLKWQLFLVYFWGGINKINFAFLSGALLHDYLSPEIIHSLEATGAGATILRTLAIATVVTELLLAIMLWIPRLRYVFAVIGIALHLGMSVFSPPFVATQIQIFAIISTALYILILLPPQAIKAEEI